MCVIEKNACMFICPWAYIVPCMYCIIIVDTTCILNVSITCVVCVLTLSIPNLP